MTWGGARQPAFVAAHDLTDCAVARFCLHNVFVGFDRAAVPAARDEQSICFMARQETIGKTVENL